MPEPSTAAKVVSRDEATTSPDRQVTKVIVDPGYDGSFTLDLDKRAAAALKVAPNVRHLPAAKKEEVLAGLRALSDGAARRVGTPTGTIDGAAHAHPAADLPTTGVVPPKVRVHFDIPGYAAMSFRYHAVKRVPGYLVFVTDTRYSGGADFHPYMSKLALGHDKTLMGAYVENGKKLYLLKPGSIVFKHDPFEFCLVPISEEKPLPNGPDEGTEELSSELPATEGLSDGEESSDRGGADAPGDAPPLPQGGGLVDRIDYSAGGAGGVL